MEMFFGVMILVAMVLGYLPQPVDPKRPRWWQRWIGSD